MEFNEITKNAVKEAVKKPRKIDRRLVDAQQARRVLDRLVGYQISPLLWRKIRRGLSAGRVQSAALKILCDREREIQAFVPEEYWTVSASLKNPVKSFRRSSWNMRAKNPPFHKGGDGRCPGGSGKRRIYGNPCGGKRADEETAAAVHYQQHAAGSVDKAQFQHEKDDDDRPAAL